VAGKITGLRRRIEKGRAAEQGLKKAVLCGPAGLERGGGMLFDNRISGRSQVLNVPSGFPGGAGKMWRLNHGSKWI